MSDWILAWFAQNLVSEGLWRLFLSAVAALMATVAAKKALDVLTDNKKMIWFFGCSLVGVFALATLFGGKQATTKPNLTARVEGFMWGGSINPPAQLKSPVLTVISIRNTGSMDSIADGYTLVLKVGGRSYTGKLEGLDKSQKLILHVREMCITYFGEDSLSEKTLNPIQVGASVTGIMIFTFQNLENDILNNEDYLELTLQFQDVNGDVHSVSDKRMVRNPTSLYIPGIRQDFQCS